MDAPERWAEIMRLQAQLFAQVQTWSQPDTPAPVAPVPTPRYHKGRFGARHGLTPAQAWLAEQLLRQKKPFRGPHKQQKEAARIRGIITAVKAGRVGNRRWGRSMLGKRGGKAMAMHGLHHLRAIASTGGEAKRDKRGRREALTHWEQTGEVLPLTPRVPVAAAWAAWQAHHRRFASW